MNLLPNNWNGIRRFYRWAMPLIMAERADEWAIDPYARDENGIIHMTPIEAWLWSDIRCVGGILYPQVPVGRFFVDFANPRAKVAIECDGAAYHQDRAKDAERDAELSDMGWTVYRITGSDCRTDTDEETGTLGAARVFVREVCEWNNIIRNCA